MKQSSQTMNAYSELYVERAQRSLAVMFDYMVWDLGLDIDHSADLFVISGLSDRFSAGDPSVVCGLSGIELARRIIEQTGADVELKPPRPTENRSREFWTGWALAYYQWSSGHRLRDIFAAVKPANIRALYSPYHEMALSQFCDRMDELYQAANSESRLKRIRQTAGLSQAELAKRTGLSLRTLQHYEQGSKDIRRAAGETLLVLARALGTSIERILD